MRNQRDLISISSLTGTVTVYFCPIVYCLVLRNFKFFIRFFDDMKRYQLNQNPINKNQILVSTTYIGSEFEFEVESFNNAISA